MTKTLTVVIPAHNEGDGIQATLLELDAFIPANFDVLIYVSEDGSSDNTREEVQKASMKAKNCKIFLAEPSERLGYSKAVIRGIKDCKSDLIAFMDGDGQCSPSDLPALLDSVAPKEIAIGYRNPRNDSRKRLIYSTLFGYAYRLFGGPKRKDPSSPFIVSNYADVAFLSTTSPKLSYGFWWEFHTRIERRDLEVVEIPVQHRVRITGETQVYSLKKIPRIVVSHLIGLYRLKKELNNS